MVDFLMLENAHLPIIAAEGSPCESIFSNGSLRGVAQGENSANRLFPLYANEIAIVI